MSEAEAISILANSKDLADQLLNKDEICSFSPHELKQLRAVQGVVKAGKANDPDCLKAAGMTLEELIILLGTLKLYDSGTWPLSQAAESLLAASRI